MGAGQLMRNKTSFRRRSYVRRKGQSNFENDGDRARGERGGDDLGRENSLRSGGEADSYDECEDCHQRNLQIEGVNILARREVVLLAVLANCDKSSPGLRHKGEQNQLFVSA